MKVKTIHLIGAALNLAVANIEGDFTESKNQTKEENALRFLEHYKDLNYSTDWAQGGPIIERENITVLCAEGEYKTTKDGKGFYEGYWIAEKGRNTPETMYGSQGDSFGGYFTVSADSITGATPLIAAMRCYVASKLGDEVDVPEELL